MPSVAIVYHSGYGHTDVIAQEVAAGLREGGAEPVLVKIENGQTDFAEALAAVGAADGAVFGSPTYMGTVSAPFKAFMDASVQPWFAQAWRDKLGAAFTVSGSPSGDKLNTLVTLAVFGMQHGMVWVGTGVKGPGQADDEPAHEEVNRLGGYLGAMAQAANESPEVTPKAGDKATGRHLGVRVAEAAKRWQAAA